MLWNVPTELSLLPRWLLIYSVVVRYATIMSPTRAR
jgi:hypothetical protein